MKSSHRGISLLSPVFSFLRFALFAVVIGVGYFVTQPSFVPTYVATPDPRRPTPALLLLLSDSSATLLDQNGSSTRLTREEFTHRFTSKQSPLEGANAANGATVFYQGIFRSPNLQYRARLEVSKADGASVIEVGGSTVVLRIGKTPLRDARVHGWMNVNTIYVTAVRDSSRAVFAVETNGAIKELATLPENLLALESRRGAVWYLTAHPGQGIESEPLPPSELHRISVNGDQLLRRDDKRIILSGIPGPKEQMAFYFSDGTGEAFGKDVAKRRPLLFLEDGRLVLRNGFELVLMDQVSGVATSLGRLPEGNVEVYEMKQIL